MKSTREKIIKTILSHPGATINDLAQEVGINGISVRHHLTSLQAEGLVTAEEERHGVGRPRLVYSITENGMEKFPSNYLKLTNRILDQLKQMLPSQQLNNLFQRIALKFTEEHNSVFASLPLDKQLDRVKYILSEEGFIIEWEKKDDQYVIRNINCPYYHIGISHPEICKIDQAIISTLLSKPLLKGKCLLEGDTCCEYTVDLSKTKA
ncbi:MAG: winged helix-turn-helix transcriptional regulator [Anaerolineaceae bacterium]|nr:winged helix-turn-helix transcriptional regulator [Anaerolineaceae bacterium]